MKSIEATTLFRFIKRTIEFPYPQICKHLVAADLLSLLGEHGAPVTCELADAVVRAEDGTAISLLKNIITDLEVGNVQ